MYQSVKNDFDNVIRHSQGIEEPKTDELFAEWATKKQRFIEAFGGLIYEYPEKVQFELSEQAKKEKFDYFFCTGLILLLLDFFLTTLWIMPVLLVEFSLSAE